MPYEKVNKRLEILQNSRPFKIIFVHMALATWRRSKFDNVHGMNSSLVIVKEKQATIAHLIILQEGLDFLKTN